MQEEYNTLWYSKQNLFKARHCSDERSKTTHLCFTSSYYIDDLALLTIVLLLKMTRKNSRKSKEETRTSLMFPSLHQDVLNAVSDTLASIQFHEEDSDSGSNNEYSTCVMGRFNCPNDACSTGGWGSKKVAIRIRGYPGNGYNAVVFNQRCQSCNRLGNMELDKSSYVERVAYRLKKWAGVVVERPIYTPKKGSTAQECPLRRLQEGVLPAGGWLVVP